MLSAYLADVRLHNFATLLSSHPVDSGEASVPGMSGILVASIQVERGGEEVLVWRAIGARSEWIRVVMSDGTLAVGCELDSLPSCPLSVRP